VKKRLLDGSDGDESRASTDTEDQQKNRFAGSAIQAPIDGFSQSVHVATATTAAAMKTDARLVSPEAKAKIPSRKSKENRKVSKTTKSPRHHQDRKKPPLIEPSDHGRETTHATTAKTDIKAYKPPKKKRAKRIRKEHKPAIITYVKESENDVLSERGGRGNNNSGNGKYLKARDRLRPKYLEQGANQHFIAKQLVQEVHDWRGRFLKRDENSSGWYVMHDKAVLVKVKQALRKGKEQVEPGEE
jgi:hypothetical protein